MKNNTKRACKSCGKEIVLTAPCQKYCTECAKAIQAEKIKASRRRAAERLRREAEEFARRMGLNKSEVKSDPVSFEFVSRNWAGETRWQYRGQKPSWRR